MDFKPFIFCPSSNGIDASLILTDFEKSYIFEERADEGWEGNGYDWASIIDVLIQERMTEFKDKIKFDPEGSMFSAYGKTLDIKAFGEKLLPLYNDDNILRDALKRAILD